MGYNLSKTIIENIYEGLKEKELLTTMSKMNRKPHAFSSYFENILSSVQPAVPPLLSTSNKNKKQRKTKKNQKSL